ncbi:MAG: serine/threonine-protein kinase, partial [Vicinamibacterales bacterium]
SPLQRLPDAEREWLAEAGGQMLVPFLGSDNSLLGILVLGDKLSDTPYSDEDRTLLTAAVSSAALVLEHRLRLDSGTATQQAVLGDEGKPALQCLTCGNLNEQGVECCLQCRGAVRPALLPLMLRGKFRVERQLGAGGMGVVYLARDLDLDRPVALKTLPRVSPGEAARLRREARSMASLEHLNLAVIHGSEVWRGLPVLVLEFLAGGTLADRISRSRLASGEVVRIGLALARALAHLHRSDILHGDVKPSNIGFSASDVPKLLDFGLARLVMRLQPDYQNADDRTTRADVRLPEGLSMRPLSGETGGPQFVGTVAYMSPEALAMAPPDSSFDLWSLAVSLFEAAAGCHPFAAPDTFQTVRLITVNGAPDLCDLLPGAPEGLARFFRMSLARRCEHRPATAQEFAAALERLAHDS